MERKINIIEDGIDYGLLVDRAMHAVVRETLSLVARDSLPQGHFFYITFNTNHKSVLLSDSLRRDAGNEMTIILQNRFWNLEVYEEGFTVVLSFDGMKQRVVVPFESLISFADPHAKFGLEFYYDEVLNDIGKNDDSTAQQDKEEADNIISLADFKQKFRK